MNQQAMSTSGSTPIPGGIQGAESRNDRSSQRIHAVLLFLHQRIGLRRLVGFLALFVVTVAAAWWGLNMGQVPVPRQTPAPDIESAALSQPEESLSEESSSEAPPSDVSLSDASSSDPSQSEASPSAGDSATGVVGSSAKKSKPNKARRKAKTTRRGKRKLTPAGDHLGVPYMKKKLY
ncbi:MAG: hypothetical protein FWH56_10530 [Betaproteobacteria bacterium]|nr:hypothetical protein [Betaproteobacteria bacterium]